MKWRAIVFAILCAGAVQAQDLGTHFRHITARDGLHSNNIVSFFKDSRGFLWMGSRGDGLFRFDGQHVKTYRHIAGDATSLLNNDVTCVREDAKGRIWVGSYAGLSIMDAGGRFQNYKKIPCDSGQIDISDGVHSMALFNGHFYLGTHKGFARVGADLKMAKTSKNFLNKGNPKKLRCIPDGMHVTGSGLWISTHAGMYFTADGNNFTHAGYNPNHWAILDMGFLPAFVEAKNGDLIFMQWGAPLMYSFSALSGKMDSVKIAEEAEFSPISMVALNDHLYWASTMFHGIAEIDMRKGSFRFIQHVPGIESSLSNDNVNEVFVDEQGSIFANTGEGVDLVHPSQCNFEQLKVKVSDDTPFPTNSSYSLYQDEKGRLWASSFSNGLYLVDPDKGNTEHIVFGENENSIWTLAEEKGKFFMGTYGGLGHFDPATKKLLPLQVPEDIAENLSFGITFIRKDLRGHWWVGLWRHGLLHITPDMKTFDHYSPEDKDPLVKYPTPYGPAIDAQGTFWMGYMESTEISSLDPATGKAAVYETVKKASDLDHGGAASLIFYKGYVWITTTNAGLLRFDPNTHVTKVFNTSNGMPSDNMNFMTVDPQGMMWIGTSTGLVRFDPATTKVQTFNYSDGLSTENFVESDLIFLRDGRGIMTAGRYMMTFRPGQMTSNPWYPSVALTSVKRSGVEIPLSKGLSELDVYYRDKTISLEFTGINFIDPDKNFYSYRLEGFEDRWVPLGKVNIINFTSLPAGDYTLYINCSNKQGQLNPKSLKFILHVHGPFWSTWWFITLMILLFLGILYGLYRFRLHRIYQLQAIRDNISRDLHDDIGSALSSISIYSDVARKMSEKKFPEILPTLLNLQITAKHAMENMSDIVWAINPKNDKFLDMVQRIEVFANQILDAKGVKFSYNVPEEITFKTLSLQQRKNIYLICKEAINNVAKYAEAAECSLHIYREEKNVVIEIKDNGVGMKQEQKGNLGGHGMHNMRKRADELHAILDIISGTQKGTRLMLKLAM